MNLSAFFLLFMCLSSPAAVATRRTSPPQCWHVIVRIPCWNVLISLPACFQNIVLLRKFRGLLFLMIIWAWTCKHWIENDSQGFRHHQSASSCSSVCPPALSFFFLRDDIFLKFPLSQSNCYLDLSALASCVCGTAACPEASISLSLPFGLHGPVKIIGTIESKHHEVWVYSPHTHCCWECQMIRRKYNYFLPAALWGLKRTTVSVVNFRFNKL